jgi:hypothetical protein
LPASVPPPFVSVQFGSYVRLGQTRATNDQLIRLGLDRLESADATTSLAARVRPSGGGGSGRLIGQTDRDMPIPSRRTFLRATSIGAAVVVVAGGAGVAAEFIRHPASGGPRRSTSGGGTATTSPRAPLLEKALTREHRLLATLAHAATTTPKLAARIAVLRADHQAHAAALSALITASEGTPTTAPSASSPAAAVAPARVADLVRWEKAAAAAVVADFDTATGAEAAVLASIHACEQTHVAWLS